MCVFFHQPITTEIVHNRYCHLCVWRSWNHDSFIHQFVPVWQCVRRGLVSDEQLEGLVQLVVDVLRLHLLRHQVRDDRVNPGQRARYIQAKCLLLFTPRRPGDCLWIFAIILRIFSESNFPWNCYQILFFSYNVFNLYIVLYLPKWGPSSCTGKVTRWFLFHFFYFVYFQTEVFKNFFLNLYVSLFCQKKTFTKKTQ